MCLIVSLRWVEEGAWLLLGEEKKGIVCVVFRLAAQRRGD